MHLPVPETVLLIDPDDLTPDECRPRWLRFSTPAMMEMRRVFGVHRPGQPCQHSVRPVGALRQGSSMSLAVATTGLLSSVFIRNAPAGKLRRSCDRFCHGQVCGAHSPAKSPVDYGLPAMFLHR